MRLVDASLPARVVAAYHGARGTRQQGNVRQVGLYLPAAPARFSIDTTLRQAHFLAQVCGESWGLSDLREEASGREYEGRRDLGNTRPGDGARQGARPGYARAGLELDLNPVGDPGLAESAVVAVDTACLYRTDHHLNRLADLDEVQAITRRVNGKRMLGLKERTAYLVEAKALLGAGDGTGEVAAPGRLAPGGSPICVA